MAMVSATDFHTQRVMASGFVTSDEFHPSQALRVVVQTWPDVYDGETISLPLPPDVPAEVPSVLLSSRDGAHRMEVSRARVNVIWHRRSETVANLESIFDEFANRLATVFEQSGAGLGRLAGVVLREASIPEPGVALSRQFCRDEYLSGPLNRPEGFELHAHKTFVLVPDVTVNSWIRIRTAKGGSPPSQYGHVTVEHDINTLAEELETRRFGRDNIVEVLSAVSREVDVILAMYFPSGG